MKALLILFFAVPTLSLGQAMFAQFDTLRMMSKSHDTIYVEDIPDVSVMVVWTNVNLRVNIYSDTTTTAPLAAFDVDFESQWGIAIDGDYFVFDNSPHSGLLYRIWYNRNRGEISQIMSINAIADKVMLLR